MNAEMQRQNFFIGGLFWDAARVAGEDLVRDPIVSQSTMGLKFFCDDILTSKQLSSLDQSPLQNFAFFVKKKPDFI